MAMVHTPQVFLARAPASGTGPGTFVEVDVVSSYEITLDNLAPGNTVTFSLWRSSDRRSTWSTLIGDLAKCGAPFLFKLDGALLLSGYIEEVTELAARGGASIVCTGRDLAAKALDWDADPAISFRQLTVEDAYRRLYDTLGIRVAFGNSLSVKNAMARPALSGGAGSSSARRGHRNATIDRGRARIGEKVWAVSESFATHVGLWQWVAPVEGLGEMAVVLDLPDYKAPPLYTFERRLVAFSDEVRGNILSGTHRTCTRAVPTRVRVYAKGQRGDALPARPMADYPLAAENACLTDPALMGGRVYVPHPAQPRFVHSSRARTQQQAEQEANRLYARSMRGARTYTVTVHGHGQERDGTRWLYAPNTTADLVDEVLGVRGKWYIHRTVFKGDRKSTTTQITMIPVDAVRLTVGVREGT